VKAGVIMNSCRVALTGQAVAPGLFDVMLLLGPEKTIHRLRLI
jgi:glutamyl-tRNA synthetase